MHQSIEGHAFILFVSKAKVVSKKNGQVVRRCSLAGRSYWKGEGQREVIAHSSSTGGLLQY